MEIYKKCLSTIKCSLAVADRDGVILYCNSGFEQELSEEQGALVGRDIQGTPVYNTQMAGSFTEEWVYMQEMPKDFYVIHYMPFDIPLDFGLLTITPSDILIKSQNKAGSEPMIPKELQSIFELSFDGLFITDGQGRILMVNSSWEKLTGFSRDDVLGRRANDLVAEGKYTQSVAELVLKTGQTETIQLEITDGERTKQKILATGVPIFDANGKVWRVVANIRDMEMFSQINSLDRKQRFKSEESPQPHAESSVDKPEVIVKSQAMQHTMDMIARVAKTDATVLFSGETGVGKDVAAHMLHSLSDRSHSPYIQLNCAAIPGPLLESELFGYVSGAFTGAKRGGKMGLFEVAQGGTLLLDEIGELPLELQAKILRVLQNKEVFKVGSSKAKALDVRIIAATNRDLKRMVGENQFRADLYFRLCVMNIVVPPLRERKEEIPYLISHFLKVFNNKYGRSVALDERALSLLVQNEWVGNVRELKNLVERLVIMGDSVITPEHLPLEYQWSTVKLSTSSSLRQAKDEVEYEILRQVAGIYPSTRKIAKALGVSQSTIIRKLKYYQIMGENGRRYAQTKKEEKP